MKIIVGLTLGIFWAVVTALLTTAFVIGPSRPLPSSTLGTTQQQAIIQAGGTLALSAAEVAKHASAGDCWFIISGKVYDVTAAMAGHPGGASTIIRHCGTDATLAFNTKDFQPGVPHSSRATADLTPFLLGNLGQTVTSQQVQQI
jgi:hypothetical protein